MSGLLRAKMSIDERRKIHLSKFVDTSLMEALKEAAKFLKGSHFFRFFTKKLAQAGTFDISIKDGRRRIFELCPESSIEPKLEKPKGGR